MREIVAHFTKERKYFENSLGREFDFTSSTGPYEYLLGALSGCLYSTFLSLKNDELTFSNVEISVKGEKREEVPTFLKDTYLFVTAKDASDEEEFKRAFLKATEECSIFQTISKVSQMHVNLEFV